MLRQKSGSIINIGSVLGLKASPGMSVHPYAVAKAGVGMLTKTTAVEYAKDGIRRNCLAPALTETPLTAPRLQDPAVRQALAARHPLGLGKPEDLAGAAVYLASNEASRTTDLIVTLDAGFMAQ